MAGYIIEKSATTSGKTNMGYDTWAEPTTLSLRISIQRGLKNLGRYNGAVDGAWGPLTIKGIQQCAAVAGYKGAIDGAVGKNTVFYSILYAYNGSGFNSWYNVGDRMHDAMYYNRDRVWTDFLRRVNR